MRVFLTGCALVALAACQPAIPDSAAGVGFDNPVNSPQVQKQRDEAITAGTTAAIPPAQTVSEETLATLQRTSVPAATPAPQPAPVPVAAAPKPKPQPVPVATAAVATAAVASTPEPPAPSSSSASTPLTTPDGVVHASPSNPAPVLMNNPGLSDENNFEAVGARRSIDADAERLANARANYKVIEPTAVPKRSGSGGPNIVSYALVSKNAVGTKVYSRVGLKNAARYQKACAGYPSDNEAQAAFLSKGGPKRDRLGLDPDGDGFACGWDPSPYRKAAGG